MQDGPTDVDPTIPHSNEVDANKRAVQELYLEAIQLQYFLMSPTFVNDGHG
jgi:hypothetical protein